MFKHRASNKHTKQGKYKRQKRKRHMLFLNPVR